MSEIMERVVVFFVALSELFEETDKLFRKLGLSKLVKRHILDNFIGQLKL